ncbi:COG1361 S-layer family protein [Salinigranum marinum]|uniref:COG1361 S-layer family protein n=1 Tax=Salinigranum marinum TaxID=1515595 RepID=UPI002989D872|nr:COG1361 S-layer family protein [Salinigranum marinum]
MSQKLLTVVLALAIVFSGVPLAAAAENQVIGRPELSLSVPDNRVEPGETKTLNVSIVNDGTLVRGGPEAFTTRVTTARAVRLDIQEVPGLDVQTDDIAVGQVAEGVTGPAQIAVTVPEDVPPGTYRLPVELSYTYTSVVTYDEANPNNNPKFNDRSATQRVTIPIVVQDRARFRVVDVETDTQIGDNGTMVASVRNVGTDPAREASVQLTSQNNDLQFGRAETAESFVGEWAPGETKQVTFPVDLADSAELRDYTVIGRVTYTDTDGIVRSSNELRASVRPLEEQSFALSAVESTLRVNYEGTVTGTVTNQGPGTISDGVVVYQPASENFDASETEYAIPDLAPGESAEFAFDIEVSSAADPGSRQLRFLVQYENEGGDSRQSGPLNARVAVDAERDPFTVEASEATVAAGDSGRLTLTVTNAEDETLSDISAKLFVDDPISSNDDEAFIGELGPGESAEITFEVSTAGSTFAKDYPVSVDFEYDREDGTTQVSDTFRLPVTVETGGGGDLPITLVAGLGALVLIGVAVVVVRRR